MNYLHVRPSPELRRRILVASAFERVKPTLYYRRALERWVARPVPLSEVEGERGPYTGVRLPISDGGARALRVHAAEWNISVNTLVVRILEHHTPHEVEALAAGITGETLRGAGSRDGT